MPIRDTHKLRALPSTGQEFILCTGQEDRFQIARYFWKNVDCKDCIALKNKHVEPKKGKKK